MDSVRLTIGQMASLNHVSEQTLRLYDKKGLLSPAEVDTDTGYRYYHITQSARLDLIRELKLYGLTLKEIKEELSKENRWGFKEILVRQKKRVEEQIKALEISKEAIDRRLTNEERYRSLPKDSKPFLQYIPERYIYSYSTETNYFESQDKEQYEWMLRKLKKHLWEMNISIADFCYVGTIMRKEHFLKEQFLANEVFIIIDHHQKIKDVSILPSAMYYCICSDDFSCEKQLAKKLLHEIKRRNYKVIGDYYCEVVLDFPEFNKEERNLFYKIQVPVGPKN